MKDSDILAPSPSASRATASTSRARTPSPQHRISTTRRSQLSRPTSPAGTSRRSRVLSSSSDTTPIVVNSPPRSSDSRQGWLSEDEAIGDGPLARRSIEKRRVSPVEPSHGPDQLQSNHQDRLDGSGVNSSLASPNNIAHSVPHRSTTASTTPSSSRPATPLSTPAALSTLSHVVPALVAILTCPGCNRLLISPTSLGCGHSICISCLQSSPALQLRLSTDSSRDRISATESQFARNPAPTNSSSPRLGQIVLDRKSTV